MWSSCKVEHSSDLSDGTINAALQAALSSVVMPIENTTSGEYQAQALSDSERRTLLAIGKIETISINPWQNGEHLQHKSSMSFYLSPAAAVEMMAERLHASDWESAVFLLAMADSELQLVDVLERIELAFPTVDIIFANRHAKQLMANENTKRFIAKSISKSKVIEAASLGGFSVERKAANNIAISEAIASDSTPVDLLAAFLNKREQRLSDIEQSLQDILSVGGDIDYALHLSGGNLGEKLLNINVPFVQAPMCVLIALGGSSQVVDKLAGVMGL